VVVFIVLGIFNNLIYRINLLLCSIHEHLNLAQFQFIFEILPQRNQYFFTYIFRLNYFL